MTTKTMQGKNWGQIRTEQKLMAVPSDLTGKRVLDIGGYDGSLAVVAIERGAKEATVFDSQQYHGYEDYKNPLLERPNLFFIHDDIMNHHVGVTLDSFNPSKPEFDVVFAFDVMYHMKNPYAFAEKLYELTGEVLCLSTRITTGGPDYWRLYKPYEQHHNDPTVAWKPTYGGLIKLMEIAGFKKNVMVYTEHPGMYEEDGFVVMRCYK
ncbi:hypothetical protein CMI37_19530 [Candidatus Pacearchaeota archaeon]|nr:hypothetical protein [Candidatus Pacearchaeota archaeon]